MVGNTDRNGQTPAQPARSLDLDALDRIVGGAGQPMPDDERRRQAEAADALGQAQDTALGAPAARNTAEAPASTAAVTDPRYGWVTYDEHGFPAPRLSPGFNMNNAMTAYRTVTLDKFGSAPAQDEVSHIAQLLNTSMDSGLGWREGTAAKLAEHVSLSHAATAELFRNHFVQVREAFLSNAGNQYSSPETWRRVLADRPDFQGFDNWLGQPDTLRQVAAGYALAGAQGKMPVADALDGMLWAAGRLIDGAERGADDLLSRGGPLVGALRGKVLEQLDVVARQVAGAFTDGIGLGQGGELSTAWSTMLVDAAGPFALHGVGNAKLRDDLVGGIAGAERIRAWAVHNTGPTAAAEADAAQTLLRSAVVTLRGYDPTKPDSAIDMASAVVQLRGLARIGELERTGKLTSAKLADGIAEIARDTILAAVRRQDDDLRGRALDRCLDQLAKAPAALAGATATGGLLAFDSIAKKYAAQATQLAGLPAGPDSMLGQWIAIQMRRDLAVLETGLRVGAPGAAESYAVLVAKGTRPLADVAELLARQTPGALDIYAKLARGSAAMVSPQMSALAIAALKQLGAEDSPRGTAAVHALRLAAELGSADQPRGAVEALTALSLAGRTAARAELLDLATATNDPNAAQRTSLIATIARQRQDGALLLALMTSPDAMPRQTAIAAEQLAIGILNGWNGADALLRTGLSGQTATAAEMAARNFTAIMPILEPLESGVALLRRLTASRDLPDDLALRGITGLVGIVASTPLAGSGALQDEARRGAASTALRSLIAGEPVRAAMTLEALAEAVRGGSGGARNVLLAALRSTPGFTDEQRTTVARTLLAVGAGGVMNEAERMLGQPARPAGGARQISFPDLVGTVGGSVSAATLRDPAALSAAVRGLAAALPAGLSAAESESLVWAALWRSHGTQAPDVLAAHRTEALRGLALTISLGRPVAEAMSDAVSLIAASDLNTRNTAANVFAQALAAAGIAAPVVLVTGVIGWAAAAAASDAFGQATARVMVAGLVEVIEPAATRTAAASWWREHSTILAQAAVRGDVAAATREIDLLLRSDLLGPGARAGLAAATVMAYGPDSPAAARAREDVTNYLADVASRLPITADRLRSANVVGEPPAGIATGRPSDFPGGADGTAFERLLCMARAGYGPARDALTARLLVVPEPFAGQRAGTASTALSAGQLIWAARMVPGIVAELAARYPMGVTRTGFGSPAMPAAGCLLATLAAGGNTDAALTLARIGCTGIDGRAIDLLTGLAGRGSDAVFQGLLYIAREHPQLGSRAYVADMITAAARGGGAALAALEALLAGSPDPARRLAAVGTLLDPPPADRPAALQMLLRIAGQETDGLARLRLFGVGLARLDGGERQTLWQEVLLLARSVPAARWEATELLRHAKGTENLSSRALADLAWLARNGGEASGAAVDIIRQAAMADRSRMDTLRQLAEEPGRTAQGAAQAIRQIEDAHKGADAADWAAVGNALRRAGNVSILRADLAAAAGGIGTLVSRLGDLDRLAATYQDLIGRVAGTDGRSAAEPAALVEALVAETMRASTGVPGHEAQALAWAAVWRAAYGLAAPPGGTGAAVETLAQRPSLAIAQALANHTGLVTEGLALARGYGLTDQSEAMRAIQWVIVTGAVAQSGKSIPTLANPDKLDSLWVANHPATKSMAQQAQEALTKLSAKADKRARPALELVVWATKQDGSQGTNQQIIDTVEAVAGAVGKTGLKWARTYVDLSNPLALSAPGAIALALVADGSVFKLLGLGDTPEPAKSLAKTANRLLTNWQDGFREMVGGAELDRLESLVSHLGTNLYRVFTANWSKPDEVYWHLKQAANDLWADLSQEPKDSSPKGRYEMLRNRIEKTFKELREDLTDLGQKNDALLTEYWRRLGPAMGGKLVWF